MIPLFGVNQLECGMLDAPAVRDLGGLLELLTAGAVQPFVIGLVQIVRPLLLDALEQRDDAAHVTGLGRPDPIVVAALELAPVVGERRRHPIDPCPGTDVRALGRLDHGLAVLVHPHEKMDGVAAQPPVAGDAVRADLFQRVPQVRVAVGIVDGRGKEELGRRHYTRSCSSVTTRVVPSSERSVTRSRKMSIETTRSFPTLVWSVLPSFGKRLRCCT